MLKKIAIIGAGPAGIFTALLLNKFAGEITLFEQGQRIGEKLRLTGGGRMNLANRNFGAAQFTSAEPNLLKKLFRSPWEARHLEIFQELGCEIVWEGDRGMIQSNSAQAEVERLAKKLAEQKNLTVQLETKIKQLEKIGAQFASAFADKKALFDIVVLTSGAMLQIHQPPKSPPEIYTLPTELGHTLTPVAPALTPLIVENFPLAGLAGLVFSGELTDRSNKKAVTGEILITHTGLSGPAVLDFSLLLESNDLALNFLPNLPETEFVTAFQKLRTGSHTVRSFLRGLLPKRLADWHLAQTEIPAEQIVAETGKTTQELLKKNLYHAVLSDITKMDYAHAWTTRGGVSLRELNVATLESKLHPRLFFAGEVLDVTGYCGGYNLSFAALSAKIVSEAIKHLENRAKK